MKKIDRLPLLNTTNQYSIYDELNKETDHLIRNIMHDMFEDELYEEIEDELLFWMDSEIYSL